MKNIIKDLILIFTLTAILLLAGCGGKTAEKTATNEKSEIVFGYVGPLTGDISFIGRQNKAAIELAVEEINTAGGVDGKTLKVIYEDGKGTGKDATNAAQKLINVDKVKVILGGAFSGETLAIAPIAEENKVLLFSAFSSNPDITNSGDFIFRNSPSDEDGGKTAAELIFNDKHKKVAILTENTDYAHGVRKVFKKKFIELGGEIVADEIYNMDSKDYRVQLTKIKATNPDAVFFNPQTGLSGGLAVKQAKELGINTPNYGTFVFSSGDALTNGGEALNELKFTDAPVLNKDDTRAVSFLDKYTSKYDKPASDYEIGARYDSVYLIKDAIESCKGVNTECMRDFLYDLEEYDGIIGKYSFDENGDLVGITFITKQIIDAEEGKIIEL